MSAKFSCPDASRNMMSPDPARNFRAVIKRLRQGLEEILIDFKFFAANTYNLSSIYLTYCLVEDSEFIGTGMFTFWQITRKSFNKLCKITAEDIFIVTQEKYSFI